MAELKVGDMGFIFHRDNPMSKVIAWFMGSRWSHSFIVLEVTPMRTYICELSDFTVTIGAIDRYMTDAQVDLEVWSPNLTSEQREKMAAASLTQYNTLFGYTQLLSLALRRMLMRIGIRIPNWIRQGLVCDQLVLYGYQFSPISPFAGMDPKSADTEEMYQMMLRSGAFTKVLEKQAAG